MNIAVDDDHEGLYWENTAGNGFVDWYFGVEAVRTIRFRDFTGQFQPSPQVSNGNFVTRSLESALL